jgi:RNA polymerase sigma-70 factor (ECF subfamily)
MAPAFAPHDHDDPGGGGGSDDYLSGLVRRYEGPLILYAQRLLRGDLGRARDVVQETFLRLCREVKGRGLAGEIRGREAAWLYTVCRRAALDVQRKERRMSLIEDQTAAVLPSLAPDPAIAVERTESAADVLRMIERLPENQREAIVLKFGHGLSYKEIAGVTGLSVSNVGFLIHTGLKAVRQRLTGAAV